MTTRKKIFGYRMKAVGMTTLMLIALFFNSFAGEALVKAAKKSVDTEQVAQAIETSAKLDFKMYPNPSRGEHINLDIEGIKSAAVEITLYNTIGKVIFHTTLEPVGLPQQTLSISPNNRLTPGLYFLSVSSKNEKLAKKLVVQE